MHEDSPTAAAQLSKQRPLYGLAPHPDMGTCCVPGYATASLDCTGYFMYMSQIRHAHRVLDCPHTSSVSQAGRDLLFLASWLHASMPPRIRLGVLGGVPGSCQRLSCATISPERCLSQSPHGKRWLTISRPTLRFSDRGRALLPDTSSTGPLRKEDFGKGSDGLINDWTVHANPLSRPGKNKKPLACQGPTRCVTYPLGR